MAVEGIAAIWAAIAGEGAAAGGAAAAGAAGGAAAAAAPSLTSTILSGLAVGAGSAAVGSLLAPKIPGAKAPQAMPDPQAQDAARRRSLAEQMGRRGRQSTILSDPTETLG